MGDVGLMLAYLAHAQAADTNYEIDNLSQHLQHFDLSHLLRPRRAALPRRVEGGKPLMVVLSCSRMSAGV